MKESGPLGGVHRVRPPGSANDHNIMMSRLEDTIIAIHCDSICANFEFLKTGL